MQVLFQDNHIIVVQKPVNMPVNLDDSQDQDLLSSIKEYLKQTYNKPGNVYLGLVHRLDRPVGGVMVFAKTSKAASRLATSLQQGQFHKTYLAVCQGQALKKAELVDYLVKDSKTNMSKVTDEKTGKLCKLKYTLLAKHDDNSLVKVDLYTGRSHQIRVQMANANLPLWGDQKYNPQAKVHQQLALYAYKLSFPHPISKEILDFTSLPDTTLLPWKYFEFQKGMLNEDEK